MNGFLIFCLFCACYSDSESMDEFMDADKRKFDESINYGIPLPLDVGVKKFEKMCEALPKQSTRNVANVMIAQHYFQNGDIDKAARLMKDVLPTEEGQSCLFSCQVLESANSKELLGKISRKEVVKITDVRPLLLELGRKK
jgi:hypothetical protein